MNEDLSDQLHSGQESVWAYPRPPALEPVSERIRIVFADTLIADSGKALRILETSHPPVYYLPPEDIRLDLLNEAPGSSYCEFKGVASYIGLTVGCRQLSKAGWLYSNPNAAYAALAGYMALYPGKMDECWVGDERAVAQPGDFYGGWITSNVIGPFKGDPGTEGW